MTAHFRLHLSTLAVLFFLLPSSAFAATLGLSPANTTVDIGSTISETIIASSADQALNAVSGVISFPRDLLQVVSISKTNSILSLWVQEPTFSNVDGTISFSGIVPNPGYTGGRGQVFSVQFRGKKAGIASVTFSSPQVLANDGNGTDILISSSPATISIVAPSPALVPTVVASPAPQPSPETATDLLARITSSTHPDQTQWYKLPHAIFDWTNAQGVSAIRLSYDENASGKPTVVYNDPISHKEIDLTDGISYFHVQEKGSSGWGPIASYRVQIDTVPPLPFSVLFPNGTTTPSGTLISAVFTTSDELSGVDHYQVAVDGKEFTVTTDEGKKPYVVSADPGPHMLSVRAYDKAGNFSLANGRFVVTGGVAQSSPFDFFAFGWLTINYISLIFIAFAIFGSLLFGAWYVHVHFSAYRHRLNKQLGVTHTHIHKEFDTLKEVITEEILTLEQAKSRRSLTREEERIVARFKKLLDQAEQTIEKDLENISR